MPLQGAGKYLFIAIDDFETVKTLNHAVGGAAFNARLAQERRFRIPACLPGKKEMAPNPPKERVRKRLL